MKVFFDSSSFAKRYIREEGSDEVDEILKKATALGLSVLSLPEVISALSRKLRESILNREQYALAKQALLADTQDADIVNVTPQVVGHAITLLEDNSVRALDALHIGSALGWKADTFISSDKKQLEAASHSGLKTKLV
ncbi:MAG: type II toxin-antitoxin system VapC family toxin [Deltaproteobacteria bacterium]|nr:type II toxin-antitoxin system VapC family toxin [Deltaproteobacteria bacterium]